jgi:hypothetical protein
MDLSCGIPEALVEIESILRKLGKPSGEIAWSILSGIGDRRSNTTEHILALKAAAKLNDDSLERLLIWQAGQQALPQVNSLPVESAVRKLLDRELLQLHEVRVDLGVNTYHFDRAAKIATLRRFPAGPMEWEISGIPRSWFLQARFPANARLLWFVASRLGGRGPCFFMHVAPHPRNRLLSVEKEVLASYYRIARSLELRPQMRALLASAWFHDPAAVRDYPHLEVLSRLYLNHGGFIATLGPAPASSGVLEGDARRKADYLAGKIQYRHGIAIWPRAAAIQWAKEHPDLAS